MKLIIGLGNPGKEYEQTRHNAGFWVVDKIAENQEANWRSSKLRQTDYAKITILDTDVLLAKPNTFMNLSGNAASSLASYYKIKTEDILIIHDDMDLPCGSFAFNNGGNPAGHHGVESVYEHFQGKKISRLRIGIGRSDHGEPGKVYVLQKPNTDQKKLFSSAITKAAEAAIDWTQIGIDSAMNEWNKYKK